MALAQWHSLANGKSGSKPIELALLTAMHDAFTLFQLRQLKYGPGNIARTGAAGVTVRVSDKAERLLQFYIRQLGHGATDESITDTWIDLMNYGAIGLMCLRGEWPGVVVTPANADRQNAERFTDAKPA
jgi:hypothetical protein